MSPGRPDWRRGPVRAVTAALARRRDAPRPRVVVRDGAGRAAVLAADDATARRLMDAAEALILAAQSETKASSEP